MPVAFKSAIRKRVQDTTHQLTIATLNKHTRPRTYFIDVEFLEGLGAVAAHEQEALPHGGFGQLGLQVPHLVMDGWFEAVQGRKNSEEG